MVENVNGQQLHAGLKTNTVKVVPNWILIKIILIKIWFFSGWKFEAFAEPGHQAVARQEAAGGDEEESEGGRFEGKSSFLW